MSETKKRGRPRKTEIREPSLKPEYVKIKFPCPHCANLLEIIVCKDAMGWVYELYKMTRERVTPPTEIKGV